MERVQLVASLTAPPSSNPTEMEKLPETVTWLQVRSDLVGDISTEWLRGHFPGKLLYSLRSRDAGGEFEGSLSERYKRLAAASQHYDLVELEAESDLSQELLSVIPPEQRMIFQRTTAAAAFQLQSRFEQISAVPARFYCIVTTAAKTSDGLQPLLFLKTLGRKDTIAFPDGICGLWSRLLTPYFGAPFLFGQLNSATSRSHEPSIRQLIGDYGFPVLRPLRKLYGIAGNPVFQSLSPRLHNAGYRALDYPALFVPFHVECFDDFWQEMLESSLLGSLGVPIHGVTIVSPYKEEALIAARASSPMVRRAASTNIFMRKNGIWEADTTDPESIASTGWKLASQNGPVKAAVIGCGGAGRAVAAALKQAGAEVTLVNRSRERAARASSLLGLPFVSLSEFQAEGFVLIINATPIGRQSDGPPFAINSLISDAIVVDLAYGTHPTPLVSGILARGGTVIDGHEVLLSQVRKQFRMMVGREMPTVPPEIVFSGNSRNFFSDNTPAESGTLT